MSDADGPDHDTSHDMGDLDVVADGLCFPEGPRWHAGALWFSDVYAGEVLRLDPDTGACEIAAALDTAPCGLGFLPDGRLLIASGHDRIIYRREPDGSLSVHADLSSLAAWHLNDMFVDRHGRAYVGDYGDDTAPPTPPHPADLILVEPDGTARPVADGMMFANGIVATADGGTLVVAETRAAPGRLTAFTIADDGSLSARRTLCTFAPTEFPDGIAIDAADNIWVASPFSGEVLRVTPEGAIDRRIAAPHPYAVALRSLQAGGSGRSPHDELFVCTAADWRPERALADRGGRVVRINLG